MVSTSPREMENYITLIKNKNDDKSLKFNEM